MNKTKQKLELLNETVRILTPKEFQAAGKRVLCTFPTICQSACTTGELGQKTD